MPSPDSESPDDSFFNDLSQSADAAEARPSPQRTQSQEAQRDELTSKQKRIACILCRKRKLRCDGTRPSCGTCKRLSHDCAYDEVRKKSGPKRGYVKLLEQRLQQVETLLKNQDPVEPSADTNRHNSTSSYVANTLKQTAGDYTNVSDKVPNSFPNVRTSATAGYQTGTANNESEGEFSWEMIGLGLEEPLPPPDVMEDLYQIYFSKVHQSLPIIHRPRFMAALNLAPHMRPPVALRYSMWTLAASVSDKYEALREHFYHRARKYAQLDEMRGHGEATITLAHCQAWTLTCTYEFKNMYFPRAWLSAGRAVRLAQMMQLHRLDGAGLDVKQCLPPPKDWTEREERRRTFWMCFAIDRYASIGTGWPMTIDEKDIMTNLPASEDAFDKSKPMATGSLDQVLTPNGVGDLQAMGGIVLSAAMFGRNLLHLHRPGPDDRDEDLNGGFWSRHRGIEQILLQTTLGLPDHMRLPAGVGNANVVFSNMCIHTSAICLHQAAIFKADKHRLPTSVSNESKIRCVTAAAEIASIMRMISHMDLSSMNPFISFCVYVAARVFVQYLKTRPKDQQMNSSLQFLLQAMQALRKKNPLTESFLVQLDIDLESAGIMSAQQKPYLPPTTKPTVFPENYDTVGCSSIFEVRESQHPSAPMNQFAGTRPRTQEAMRSMGEAQMPSIPSLDMNAQTASFMMSQTSMREELLRASATNSAGFASEGYLFPESAEMDLSTGDQASPSTINSQSLGGSASQSSYSPGQANEHNLAYRPSPGTTSRTLPVSQHTQATSAGAFGGFGGSGDMPMSAYTAADAIEGTYDNSYDWEFSAMGSGSGMTPMSEGSWNQLVENVTMGWDVTGTGGQGK